VVSAPTTTLLPAVDISKSTPILTIATSNVVHKPTVFQAVEIDSPKSTDTIKVVTSETRDDGKRPLLDLRHISNASSKTLVTEDAVVFPTCQEISQSMVFATTQSLNNERSTEKSKNISPEAVVEKKSSRTVVLLVEDNIINLKVSLQSPVSDFYSRCKL
jgi:hypothetical protein